MIYATVGNKNYAIAMVEASTKDIPVSFEAKTMGEYTLSVSSLTKRFDNVYLVDKLTGDVTNMLIDDYTFIATTNDNPERFVLKLYEYDSIEETDEDDNYVYVNNNELIINNVTSNTVVQIFDMMGREVMSVDGCVENVARISTCDFETGIYIVRKINDRDVNTQKVVIHK